MPVRERARCRALALGLVVLALVLGAFALGRPTAHADSISVTNLAEHSDDPTALTFTARIQAPAGLKSAQLVYKVLNPDANVGGGGPGSFGPGAETDVSFKLDTITPQRYIP